MNFNVKHKIPEVVRKAANYARSKHQGQKDDTGKDYFDTHVIQVVNIVKQVTDDPATIAAAYLHDVIEDCDVTKGLLGIEFTREIANLVWELTKDEWGQFSNLESRKAVLIKFADRLSNLSRMETWSDERKQQYIDKSNFWKNYEE